MFRVLYPFHIKPIMRSQRRFENNAVWCERSESALFDTGVKKAAFNVGGLQLPREVFWKRILAKSRSLRRCGCQCEKVYRIMRRERPKVIPIRALVTVCMDRKAPGDKSPLKTDVTGASASCKRSLAIMKVQLVCCQILNRLLLDQKWKYNELK